MNVAVLSGLNATDNTKKDSTTDQGWWAKAVAWMKANPGKTGIAIGSVILLIFLIWWFNRKPKRKRTSGLAGPKRTGTKKTTRKKSRKRKSTRKKKAVNGLSGLGLPQGFDSSNAYVLCYDKTRIKPSCAIKPKKSTKKKTTTKKSKR